MELPFKVLHTLQVDSSRLSRCSTFLVFHINLADAGTISWSFENHIGTNELQS